MSGLSKIRTGGEGAIWSHPRLRYLECRCCGKLAPPPRGVAHGGEMRGFVAGECPWMDDSIASWLGDEPALQMLDLTQCYRVSASTLDAILPSLRQACCYIFICDPPLDAAGPAMGQQPRLCGSSSSVVVCWTGTLP